MNTFPFSAVINTVKTIKLPFISILWATSLTAVIAGPIDTLPALHWYEAPNTQMNDVAPAVIPPGVSGVKSIMDAWNGGVYDTKRDRLIVWGGGHGNYSGNEIYAFDVNTLQWERITEPSSLQGWTDTDTTYQDGRPVSRHTYNYLTYLPEPFDNFFVAGGTVLYASGYGDDDSYLFDFNTLEWQTITNKIPNRSIAAISVWDPVTETVFYHNAGGGSYMSQFNPKTNTWIARGNFGTENEGWIQYQWGATIDPIRRKFVAIGNGNVYIWNIADKGNLKHTKLITSGDTEILDALKPGVAYDQVLDKIVAWAGGTDVYVLDLETAVWTRIAPAATNTVTPTTSNENGTFGRFRYIPSKNAYIVVNKTNENVYFFRLSTSPTLTKPAKPAKPSSNKNNL